MKLVATLSAASFAIVCFASCTVINGLRSAPSSSASEPPAAPPQSPNAHDWEPPKPYKRESAAELDAKLAAFVNKSGKKVGPSSSATLEAPTSLALTIKNNYCYAVEVRLAGGASWPTINEPAVVFSEWRSGPMNMHPYSVTDTGAYYEPGCASQSAKIDVGFAGESGTGGYTMQVYERKPSAAELEAVLKARAEDAELIERIRERECTECSKEFGDARRVCLERRGRKAADCGW